MMLRLQSERMNGALLPSAHEYFKQLRTDRREARAREAPDAIVMHPGPDEPRRRDRVVGGRRRSQSVILPQVTFGIAVRMAVMSILAGRLPRE